MEIVVYIVYNTILVPTDGSESASRAAESGLDLAGRYDATVHALYVVDTSDDMEFVSGGGGDGLRKERRQRGRSATASLADRAESEGLDVETAVREGVPYEEILDYTRENDVDLIVMGGHGSNRSDKHLLLGSVTEKVLRAAPVPVHLVRTADVAVGDVGTATSMARDALAEAEFGDANVVDVHRSGATWFVRSKTADGGARTVAVDIESGDVSIESGEATPGNRP